jgi:hypothetical protein
MFRDVGVVELSLSCILGLLGLGLPVAILVLLVMVYNKLKNVEALLNKDR